MQGAGGESLIRISGVITYLEEKNQKQSTDTSFGGGKKKEKNGAPVRRESRVNRGFVV